MPALNTQRQALTNIEAIIFVSLFEYKDRVSYFLQSVPKEWFSEEAKNIYELLSELYFDSNKPFELIYFIESNLSKFNVDTLELIMTTLPTTNFEKYYTLLQNQYIMSVQKVLGEILMRSDKVENLQDLSESVALGNNEIRNISQWIDFYQNKKNVIKYETGVNFLDIALKGGIELSQLVLISGEYEAGKTSLALQILEFLSLQHKTALFSFEFPIKKYVIKKHEKLSRDVMQGYLSQFQLESILNNMYIIDDGMEITQVTNNIVYLQSTGVKFFVIDSQMRLNMEDSRSMEEQESEKFAKLANLAHKFDIVIFLIVQTSKNDTKSPLGSKKGGHYSSITIRIEHNKSKDKENYQDENTRTVIIQKNKQTGIHGKYIVNFDTENLTFHSDDVIDYKSYQEIQNSNMQNSNTFKDIKVTELSKDETQKFLSFPKDL